MDHNTALRLELNDIAERCTQAGNRMLLLGCALGHLANSAEAEKEGGYILGALFQQAMAAYEEIREIRAAVEAGEPIEGEAMQ